MSTSKNKIRLFFLMSLGVGLERWEKNGTIERELAVIRNLTERGIQISVITFDTQKSIKNNNFRKRFDNLEIISVKPFWIPQRLLKIWAIIIPIILFLKIRKCNILYTNQSLPCFYSVLLSKLFRKKLIVRAGYVYGDRMEENANKVFVKKIPYILNKFKEKIVFRSATACILPTDYLANWVIEKYKIKKPIVVIPNSVNTMLFKKLVLLKKPNTIVSVGRLNPVKQYGLLVSKLANTNFELHIYGDGPERHNLENFAAERNCKLFLHGNTTNELLVEKINSAEFFILPSKLEGNPKALIEAMACGAICIGTNVKGISNIIQDGINGFLCNSDIDNILDVISKAKNSMRLDEISNAARNYALSNFSLESASEKIFNLINNVAS